MFKQLGVTNFRCFSSLHLRDLARINLIAGKNNAGKTALLEAIQLHNNPATVDLLTNITQCRSISSPDNSERDIASWLFYDKHAHAGLGIWTLDDAGITRQLSICILDALVFREKYPDLTRLFPSGFPPDIVNSHHARIVMRFEHSGVPDSYSVATTAGSGYLSVSARIDWEMPSIFIASSASDPEQDIRFFGELEIAKRQEEVLPALRILEPRLQRLSLAPLAKDTVIHGDVGLLRLLPVQFMGEGIRRMLSILLALANAKGGVLLIDEIENGFHYSVHKQVWQAIAVAARQNNVQVFATTHSWECIKAAHAVFSSEDEYDFTLNRLENVERIIRVVSYTKETLDTSVEMNMEVR